MSLSGDQLTGVGPIQSKRAYLGFTAATPATGSGCTLVTTIDAVTLSSVALTETSVTATVVDPDDSSYTLC